MLLAQSPAKGFQPISMDLSKEPSMTSLPVGSRISMIRTQKTLQGAKVASPSPAGQKLMLYWGIKSASAVDVICTPKVPNVPSAMPNAIAARILVTSQVLVQKNKGTDQAPSISSLVSCVLPLLQTNNEHFNSTWSPASVTNKQRTFQFNMQLPFTNKHFKLREILHAFKIFPVCYTITTIPYNTFYTFVLYINFLFFHFSKKQVKQTKKR